MADGGGPTEQDRSEGTPSLSEGPDAGARPFGSFWGVCQKGLAVRAKPPAAITTKTDMHTITKNMVGPKAAKPHKPHRKFLR
ncbi:hypothetical protein BK667_30150 [Pseudomonas frederiksbergensis]|nr:hypothetical protein BK667_30150 [Pseudomonas frederiksbergensis]